jgi:hypothetical protein
MKNQKLFLGFLSAAALLAFAACAEVLQRPAAGTEGLAPGKGRAVVIIAAGEARTALPGSAVGLAEYRVSFTREGAGTPAWSGVTSSASVTADLEGGAYAVTVTAYDGSGQEAAAGSGEITVSPEAVSSIEIQLFPGSSGTGVLRYTLGTAEDAVFQYGTLSAYALPSDSLYAETRFENESGGVLDLPAGYYRVSLSAYMLRDGVMWSHTKTAAAHVYLNKETELSMFLDEDSLGALGVEYSAGTAAEFDAALASIQNNGDKNTLVKITADFSHAPVLLAGPEYNCKTITIQSADTGSVKTISLSGKGSLFTVGAQNVMPTLVLSAVKLAGHTTNDAVLVKIEGGLVIISGEAEISGNTNTYTGTASYYGSGIAVESGALLRMYGGAVKNNTLSRSGYGQGGGVAVRGTFEMYDGSVDHNRITNTASGGAGVSVESGGLFRLYGGSVQHNSIEPSYGYYRGGGVLVYGDFAMHGGSIEHNAVSNFSSNNDSTSGIGVYVGGSGNFTMKGGVVAYHSCEAAGYGAGVYTEGSFTMEGGAIHDNKILEDLPAESVFAGRIGNGYGGGIYCHKKTITLKGGAIYNNIARYGGGVCLGSPNSYSPEGTLAGTEIYENTANFGGGGIAIRKGTLTMTSGSVRDNSLSIPHYKNSLYGGGILILEGALIMNGGSISGNRIYVDPDSSDGNKTSSAYGGGIGIYKLGYNSFVMNGGTIENNSIAATKNAYGGGIYAEEISITINGGRISGNTLGPVPNAYGAGVCAIAGITVNGAQTQISGNKADTGAGTVYGGGIYAEGAFVFSNGAIHGNDLTQAAGSMGGGVYVKPTKGSITMSGGSVLGNRAYGGGGIAFYDNSSGSGIFYMRGGTIGGNSATGSGGGIYLRNIGGFEKDFSGASTDCGVIYGAEVSGSGDFGYDLRNTGNGAAVYYYITASQEKVRNTTVGAATTLFHDTADNWTD